MALWTQEREYDALPLADYQASRGSYLGAVIDDAWQQNPLPSLLRWAERRAMDYGEIVRANPAFMAFPETLTRLAGGDPEKLRGTSRWLSLDEVAERSKPLGLNLRRAMSEEAFESIADERRRQLANQSVFDRARINGGYGAGLAAVSVLAEFATAAVDPINLGSAFVPVSRLGPVARAMERIGSRDARFLARGAIEGAVGAAAVEPLVALAATDENPAYGFSHGLLNVAFGAALGGGLHWLGGRIVGADATVAAPRASQRSAADVLRGEGAEPASTAPPRAPEAPAGEQPRAEPASAVPAASTEGRPATDQATARAIEKMSPEARQTLLETIVRQSANDLTGDVDAIARATGQWIAPPVRVPPQVAALGRRWDVDIATLRAEQRELQTLHEDIAQRMAADPGQRIPVPADFKPGRGELAEARMLKSGTLPGKAPREPETLAAFVKRAGGIDRADPIAGDLRANDLGGLAKKGGRRADDLTEAAYEAGYYTERPTIEQLVADLTDVPKYADHDALAAWNAHRMGQQALDAERERLRSIFDLSRLDEREIAWLLKQDPTTQRLAELDDLQARGLISEEQALERAAMLDSARAADEAAEAQAMLDVIAAARRDIVDQGPTVDAHKTTWIDTRGQGQQFHGTSRPIAELDDWAASTMNIYGQGFYTTDAVDIARGYTKKGKGQQATLYRTTEQGGPHKLYDMEKALTSEHRAAIEKKHLAGYYEDYVDQLAAAKTLREFYDEVRAESRENGHSADTIQELFDGIRAMFEAEGYRGFTHAGGVLTGNRQHHVAIYWFPSTDVKIAPVDWRSYEVAGKAHEGAPLTREEFDAIERSIADAEARGVGLPEDTGRPLDAGDGQNARAPRADGEPGSPADRRAVSGSLPPRALGEAEALGAAIDYDLGGWIKRQADWRADAHADAAASVKAEQIVATRAEKTPQDDLAELQAATAKIFDDEDKAALAEATKPFDEAAQMADAFALCGVNPGGSGGGARG